MRNVDQLIAIKELVHALLEEIESLAEPEDPSAAPPEMGEGGPGFYQMIEAYEKYLIRRALAKSRGQKAGAARLLGLNPTTLHYKLKVYGIGPGAGAAECGVEAAECGAGVAAGSRVEACAQGGAVG